MLTSTPPPVVLLDWDRPALDLWAGDLMMPAAPGPDITGPVPAGSVSTGPVLAAPISGLPAYSAILHEMLVWLDQIRGYRLWQEIFGEDHSANHDRAKVELEFLERVRSQLFEFDLLSVYDIVYRDETPLISYIPVTGHLIPWETGYTDDLETWQQFLAITMIAYRDPEVLMYDDRPGYFGDVAIPRLDWLAAVEDETFAELQQRARPHLERLSNLPAPFDALAILVRGALGLSDNLFLALPDAEFRQAYNFNLELAWIPDHIRWLAAEYDRALPAILRIKAFASWFENQDDEGWANQAIAAALAGEDLTPWLDTGAAVRESASPEVEL